MIMHNCGRLADFSGKNSYVTCARKDFNQTQRHEDKKSYAAEQTLNGHCHVGQTG